MDKIKKYAVGFMMACGLALAVSDGGCFAGTVLIKTAGALLLACVPAAVRRLHI